MDCQKLLFDIPDGVTYLNTAYMSPLLKKAAEIGHNALNIKLRPYEMKVDDFFVPVENVKKSFSQLINNPDHNRIAIIPSVSYGMANACQNIDFRKGDEVVVVSDQFPSNIYPWMELVKSKEGKLITIQAPDTIARKADEWNDRIIQAINSNTKVVALPHVHWSEGIIFNLKAIRERLDQFSGYLIIDGTQSLGALPFSIAEIRPDALIVSGYKWMMGPYGLGLAYYNDRFDGGVPIENNWINRLHSEDFTGLVNYQDAYKPKANRYGVGESSNFASIPVLQYALDKILEWTPEEIQEYCGSIVNKIAPTFNEIGFHVSPQEQRSNHLFGIKIPDDIPIERLKSAFVENNTYVSFRGNYIRVSPFVFNSEEDLKVLLDVFVKVRPLINS